MGDSGAFWDTERDAVQFARLKWIRGSFMGKPMVLDVMSDSRVYPPCDHVYEYYRGSSGALRSKVSESDRGPILRQPLEQSLPEGREAQDQERDEARHRQGDLSVFLAVLCGLASRQTFDVDTVCDTECDTAGGSDDQYHDLSCAQLQFHHVS